MENKILKMIRFSQKQRSANSNKYLPSILINKIIDIFVIREHMFPLNSNPTNYTPFNFSLKSDYTQTQPQQPNYFQFLQESVKNPSSTNRKKVNRASTIYTDHFSSNQDDSDTKNIFTYTTRTTLANTNSNLSFNTRPNFYTSAKDASLVPQQIKTQYKYINNADNRVSMDSQTQFLKKSDASSRIDELDDQKFAQRPQFVFCEEEGEVIIQSKPEGKARGCQNRKTSERKINQHKQINKELPKYNLFSLLDQCGNNGCHRQSIKNYEFCPAKVSKNNPWI